MEKLFVYTDGGARGNPGPGAIGVVIMNEKGSILLEHKEKIGKCTNNQAEYRAIIKGLELAEKMGGKEIHCFLDSQLVARQATGKYKIKNEVMKKLNSALKEREKVFKKVTYTNVRRTNPNIREADRLVNEALDG